MNEVLKGTKKIEWTTVLALHASGELEGVRIIHPDGSEEMIKKGYDFGHIEGMYRGGCEFGITSLRTPNEIIKEKMERAGVTQTELAEMIGDKQQNISRDLANTKMDAMRYISLCTILDRLIAEKKELLERKE